MTEKDWVLLIVPIVANGVLVSYFQYIISNSIENKTRVQRNHYIILEKFHLKLSSLYGTCKGFVDSLNSKYQDVGDAFNREVVSYKEIKVFFLTYGMLLPRYEAYINQLCHEMDNVHREMVRIQVEYESKISSQTILHVAEHHNKMVKVLEQAIDCCGNELDKMYPLN